MNPSFLPTQAKRKTCISEIAEIINKRLLVAYKHLATRKYTCGAISIPYVSKHIENRVRKQLILDDHKNNMLFSCHDHDTRCSVICINMWDGL